MRKIGFTNSRLAIALLVTLLGTTLATTAQADTIRLKNGSIIKGKVTSFADEQFVVLLDSGSGRSMSKAMIYIADVAKIDFDASSEPSASPSSTARETSSTPVDDSTTRSNPARDNAAVQDVVREGPPVDPRLNKSSNTKNKSKEVKTPNLVVEDPPTKEPESKPTEKPGVTTEEPTTEPVVRKPLANARTINVDVAAKRDWTSTGVIVKRGDRIRITAAGTINLDANGQASGPEGIDLTDARRLMTDKPTGGLIGVIGADNDDFVFIGRTTEFTATRDGLLFLSVNEGTLTDNSGAFKAVIEVQAARPGARQ